MAIDILMHLIDENGKKFHLSLIQILNIGVLV